MGPQRSPVSSLSDDDEEASVFSRFSVHLRIPRFLGVDNVGLQHHNESTKSTTIFKLERRDP
jgi:hypothetical protein